MADYSTAVQKLASADFLIPHLQTNIWRNYVDDRSMEFPGYGKTLVISTSAGAFNEEMGDGNPSDDDSFVDDRSAQGLGANAENATPAQLKYGEPIASSLINVELEINQWRDINRIVGRPAERRLRPNLVSEETRKAAASVMKAENAHLRKTIIDSAGTRTQRTPITVTAANFAQGAKNDAFKTALLDEPANANLDVSVNDFWPMPGRRMIVSPRIHKYITDALQEEKLLFTTPINDRFVAEGETIRYKGWDIVQDNSAGDGTANTDDDKHAIIYLIPGRGLAYAGELEELMVGRHPDYRGTILRGFKSWGAAVIEPYLLRVTKINIT